MRAMRESTPTHKKTRAYFSKDHQRKHSAKGREGETIKTHISLLLSQFRELLLDDDHTMMLEEGEDSLSLEREEKQHNRRESSASTR